MSRSRLQLLLLAALLPSLASAYEQIRREEVDGGVHVPVLTKPPELVQFVQATYPPEAAAQGLIGDVTLTVTIAADGSVAEATVKQPAGHGFDEAAVEAVKKFQFTPAEVDGQPAAIQIEYVYHFTLAQPEAPDAGVEPPPPPKATLKGRIIARGSTSRVGGASVRCGDDADAPEASSDEEGLFELTVTPGVCEVRVVANGYELYKTRETLAPGETTEVVYYLIAKAIGFETVVRGTREKKEVVRRTLERQELQRIPGTFGDPIRVLQNMPGVARAPFISGALIVRGAAPDQTLTFLDGVNVPLLYHLGGGPSVVNAEFLDRIDFYPGGFGARYGRAVGGVVDVATRKGAADTLHGSAKVDLLDSGFFVEAPLRPGVSVAAAARRSYVDILLPLVLPKDPEGGSLLVLPRYWDYQVRLDLGAPRGSKPEPGVPLNSYYLMAFGSDDVLNVVATGGGRNRDVSLDFHTLFHRLKGDWTFRQGKVTSVLSPYAGYDLGSGNFGVTKFSSDIYNLGVREDLTLELFSWLTTRTGADVYFTHLWGKAELPIISGTQYVGFPGAQPKTEIQQIERFINTFDGALYLETDVKLGPVTVTPGIRGSRARVYGHNLYSWDPRVWLRYQMLPGTALKGSAGLYTQPPAGSDLEAPPFGNPNLVHEKAFQTSVGVEHKFTDAINVDVVGYYNRRYDNIVSPGVRTVNPDGSVTQELYSNAGLGRAYGLEVLLRHEVTRNFFGWVAYTLNRSEQRRAGSDNDYRLTGFDQTHILTVVGSYRFPYGIEAGMRFRLVTGRPTTPIVHNYDIYGVDGNSYSGTPGEALSERLPTFHQLDFRVDKSFVFQSWTLGFYIDIQNVYNAQNQEASFYDYRFRQEIPVPGIPFLPVVGVKGSF